MKLVLERIINVREDICISIVLQTHKTHPDNQRDSILLKNLITKASKRLVESYDSATAKRFTEKLNRLSAEIDHNHNDNGLLLFVSESISEYVRIATHPTTRVIIADTFATRPIIRALNQGTDYFILVLSRGHARLIEASSSDLIKEIDSNNFPLTENKLQPISKEEAADASRITNLTQEFFNRIDKAVNKVRSENPLPVVVYSEETNYSQYMKVADYPNTILGHLLLKNQNEKASNLVKEVWPFVRDLTVAQNRDRISELKTAVNEGKFLSDLNEIWQAVQQGKGKTIFIEEKYYQPAQLKDGVLTPIDKSNDDATVDIDDVVDEMIEFNLKFGGDTVFVEKGSLENFNKIALITRY